MKSQIYGNLDETLPIIYKNKCKEDGVKQSYHQIGKYSCSSGVVVVVV